MDLRCLAVTPDSSSSRSSALSSSACSAAVSCSRAPRSSFGLRAFRTASAQMPGLGVNDMPVSLHLAPAPSNGTIEGGCRISDGCQRRISAKQPPSRALGAQGAGRRRRHYLTQQFMPDHARIRISAVGLADPRVQVPPNAPNGSVLAGLQRRPRGCSGRQTTWWSGRPATYAAVVRAIGNRDVTSSGPSRTGRGSRSRNQSRRGRRH